jgi:hypothetical protein
LPITEKNNEINIVALNEYTKEILFAECKWQTKKVGIKVYDELKEKSKLVNWNNGERKEYFVLFSKAGFTPRLRNENVLLFDLHDQLPIPFGQNVPRSPRFNSSNTSSVVKSASSNNLQVVAMIFQHSEPILKKSI